MDTSQEHDSVLLLYKSDLLEQRNINLPSSSQENEDDDFAPQSYSMSASDPRINNLIDRAESLEAARRDAVLTLQALQRDYERDTREINASIEAVRKEKEQIDQRRADAQNEARGLQEKNAQLEAELDQLENEAGATVAQLKAQLAQALAQKKELQAKVDQASARVADTDQHLQSAQQLLGRARTELSRLKSEVAREESRISEQEGIISTLQSENSQFQSRIQEINSGMAQDKQEVKARLDELQGVLTQESNNLTQLERTRERAQARIRKSETDCRALKNERAEIDSTARSRRAEINELTEETAKFRQFMEREDRRMNQRTQILQAQAAGKRPTVSRQTDDAAADY